MKEKSANAGRVNEAYLSAPRSWSPDIVDCPDAFVCEPLESAVDVGGFEGDVMQTRATSCDEASDRTAVLSRIAGISMIDYGFVLGTHALEELELAVTCRDECHAYGSDEPRRAAVIDHAIFVRCEALECGFDFDVGLLAFELAPESPAKLIDGGNVVRARNADMIEPFDRRRARWSNR